ncbi:putative monogalactosyldiacylglycerol synthase 3, chloroplastic [Curcuma longa]|uniref:putative monogalactosyldiacylglycerol synthase 3, chloroplastic n=1 Tax=Curcuma longa TaxID=136217 RepID=UPI003D9F620B
MESSYKFMVKHVQLWRMAFHGTSPRWIHNLYLAAIASFYTKKVEAGLKKYKPDIIISVHPLMQHIPLLVLKWKNLQNKVVFVTVITDLNTCHPTWFHSDVNRCYCPSEEVAKRAALDGLQPSQIHVSGLPIRPSFCRAVLVKDELRKELEMDSSLYLSMMAFELYGMLAGNASPVGSFSNAKELKEKLIELHEGSTNSRIDKKDLLFSQLQTIKMKECKSVNRYALKAFSQDYLVGIHGQCLQSV